ncbi:hypothetical protein OUZ56_002466 [Daphnia magna]|uniref:C2H2-type domain-containing protein n=1 Tax=Daphnia magna TaxID=35525 RepID=A0ABR0A5T0_9CRUS|nr:hypothetical protein OUZ56_002466 [Daphnia magna]
MAVLLTAEVSYSSLKEIRFQHDCILVQLCTGKDVLIRSILVFPTCLCTGTCSLKVVDYERLNSHLHLEIHLTKPKILRLRKHKLKKLQEKKYGRVIVFYYSALVVGCCATQQRRRKTHFCEVYSTPLWMFCEVRMLSRFSKTLPYLDQGTHFAMCMQLCFDLPKNWTFNIFLCWSAISLPASNGDGNG